MVDGWCHNKTLLQYIRPEYSRRLLCNYIIAVRTASPLSGLLVHCHNDLILSANNGEASLNPVDCIWASRPPQDVLLVRRLRA